MELCRILNPPRLCRVETRQRLACIGDLLLRDQRLAEARIRGDTAAGLYPIILAYRPIGGLRFWLVGEHEARSRQEPVRPLG